MSTGSYPRIRSLLFHVLRVPFRLLPLGEAKRDALRRKFFDRFTTIRPQLPRGVVRAGNAHRGRAHAGEAALGHVTHQSLPLPNPLPATLVAFYLPQFHVIPENDAWWGKGFTEWRNAARALPQFEGHAQPRLPGDLGFYDLRNPQVMRDQAQLARAYGIGAFCFYFYWFGGKTLLEAPLQQWLADASIDLPCCLCWANEDWSRRWDGQADDILIAQSHDAEDDLAFIAHVAPYLRDPRYLRVDGKPLLLIYRPGLLPDAAATIRRWRDWCLQHGIGELFVAYVQGFERPDPRTIGCDAAVEFPPNLATPANITARQSLLNADYAGEVLDWRELADEYRNRGMPDYRLFPGVNCGWDNEPRRPGRGRTYLHASPHAYEAWLRHTIHHRLRAEAPNKRLVFINAWNEWAEGAVLEPDARFGHAWLHATRAALVAHDASMEPNIRRPRACAVIHAWYPDVLEEILASLLASGERFRIVITTAPEKSTAVRNVIDKLGITAEIEIANNHGRDILPFLRVAYRLRDEGETCLLKLHTKHSPHRSDGALWRRSLLDSLLPVAVTPRLVDTFERDQALGIIYPDGHLQPLTYFWGANEANVQRLCTRLGIPEPQAERDHFISGSMCWIRMEALSPLLDTHLHASDFEPEIGQVDGTLAHAIERVFVLSAKYARLDVVAASSLTGVGVDTTTPGPYPYATRD